MSEPAINVDFLDERELNTEGVSKRPDVRIRTFLHFEELVARKPDNCKSSVFEHRMQLHQLFVVLGRVFSPRGNVNYQIQ